MSRRKRRKQFLRQAPQNAPRYVSPALSGYEDEESSMLWGGNDALRIDPEQSLQPTEAQRTFFRSPECIHAGNAPLFEISGARVFCLQEKRVEHYKYDLVIDLTNWYRSRDKAIFPERYESLSRFVGPSANTMFLPWEDHSVPPTVFQFWAELYGLLKGDVAICCVGSHGRTGTAAALLWAIKLMESASPDVRSAWGKNPRGYAQAYGFEAVDLVRKFHCSKAVETAAQRDYVPAFCEWYIRDTRIFEAVNLEESA